MLLKIVGGELYAPEYLGQQDLLIAGQQIQSLGESIDLQGDALEILDARGCWVVPGFVDSLVHITGGGGEGGFATRTPEMPISAAVRAGVTTLIGALGTDAVTQTLPNLLAKARAIEASGLTCYCHTGSYQVPVRTLTGSITDDIVLVDRFIGVGEVALSDHRSSHPSREELIRLASEARIGGMLSGKAGLVLVHLGDAPTELRPLLDVIEHSALPITQFQPTHINRNPSLLGAGFDYARQGGYIDFTTSTTPELLAQGEIACAVALRMALDRGVPPGHISFSSDGYASLPQFDAQGRLVGMQVGQLTSLWDAVRQAIQEERIAPEQALRCITRNPADMLRLPHKGRLQAGGDADLVLIDAQTLTIRSVMAQGRFVFRDGEVLCKGLFE